MTFKLRSGNKTPFKMMGSSPVKQEEKKDTRNEATKELDIALDQIDRYRLYRATQKDKNTAETTGVRGRETLVTTKSIQKNRKGRNADGHVYPTVGNTTIPVTTNTTSSPSYMDPVTEEHIDTKDVSIKNRNSNFNEFLEENPNYDNVVSKRDGSTDSRNRTFDAENNIMSTTSTTTRGHLAPKVDMPTISLEQKTAKLNTTPPEPVVKKAKLPLELRPEKKKEKKVKVKKEVMPPTHLGPNSSRRSRFKGNKGRRKNRTIAGLTFWNSKD